MVVYLCRVFINHFKAVGMPPENKRAVLLCIGEPIGANIAMDRPLANRQRAHP